MVSLIPVIVACHEHSAESYHFRTSLVKGLILDPLEDPVDVQVLGSDLKAGRTTVNFLYCELY